VAFAHLTDLHVIDASSPAHPAFLAQYDGMLAGAPLSNASRPQEMLTVHVLAAMVRRINAIARGPVTGRDFDFAISTGDNADSRGMHELMATLRVLNGGEASFTPTLSYEGLQAALPAPPGTRDAFWHGDPATADLPPDRWKRSLGFPEIPDFTAAAVAPVASDGLAFPWYTGFGNHDLMNAGVLMAGSGPARFLDDLATGDRLPLALPEGVSAAAFFGTLAHGSEVEAKALIAAMPMRAITPSLARRPFDRDDFIRAHLEQPGPHGPVGHGFAQENLETNTAYYRFDMADGVVGLMLDSTNPAGGPDGSIDPQQVEWLEAQLQSLHSRHFSPDGSTVASGGTDRLVVLFSHHNSITLDNYAPDPDQAHSPRMGSAALKALLWRYPNVILWVNGHLHVNRIWAHPDPGGRGHGFWEVNTAAHIDWPQQSRTIELTDNGDGTLSILTVMVDHSDPESLRREGPQDAASLAALSLELALNDPSLDAAFRLGRPEDTNAELVIRRPF
jgi:metallophosphoesterase (TIGR03767 family)